ncbi:amino acid adenylation domain-containing protein [Bradyrhizobium sp. CSA112]|uniref:non-ribosomal peptide synthetase n=1 Tax=Bradyrhizobium sp. CSA112 TaxID=2699170 RepID=UPI0023AF5627|nr:non-ribosomal peptide synthetase [Bradyrhizobium sp. CSA112]MDE5452933.1 amino acid adenylation domain-containing protein [Bradyrhizobium sp. CSA112]
MPKVTKALPRQDAGEAGQHVFACLGDLLAHYGRISPNHPAILAPGRESLTYGALWARTNEIVRELRDLGIGRSDRVAVVLPGGADAAVATIAVAAGAVCVPLHPGFAANEWRRYFGDLRVAALLTHPDVDSASRGVAYSLGIPVIDLSHRSREVLGAFSLVCPAARPAVVGELAADANDAFILLTSGSTAQPKLVPLSQASVCRSAYNAGAALVLEPQDRLLNVLPLVHAHGLISGLLTALAAGSSVVCPPAFDALAFFGWLTKFRPTWYTAVPPIHRALISAARRHKRDSRLSSLRVIRSASASLPTDVLDELEELFGVPVVETYGMTEAASQIAANPLERRKPGSVGKPTGVEIAVMDSEGRPLPAGERGEVALRGPTVARGYDNNEVATESAFQGGWFRTGDLGYMDTEGYLFLLGRIKKADVINRGGQKVSPAEVERAFLSHPNVAQAVAFPITHTRLGEDVAVAVVLRAGAKISSQQLRRFASEHLARFKVPGLIRIVPAIPSGPDSTIVRGELATLLSIATPRSRVERNAHLAAPRSETEWQLAKLWADLLELNEVGVDEDVFALGADSLTVAQLLSRLRARFGVDCSFRDVFDAPTVASLAALIEPSKKDDIAPPGLRDIAADSRGRLSLQQQRIYVLSGIDRIEHKFHVVAGVLLSGPLDPDLLEASVATIGERHEALRSIFMERLGEPMQTVTTVRPCLERFDLRPLPEPKRAGAIQSRTWELLQQPFDIEREPPIGAQLLRLDEYDYALLIKLHHLITDGWSQRLFLEELEVLYNAGSKGIPAKLPEIPFQYRHFVEWQRAWLRTSAAAAQLNYWRGRLEGLTELPLRTDWPRPNTWTGRGARLPLTLSQTLSGGIKSLSRTHNATLFMTLLAAFQCLLCRYTQHEDIAVGSLIANRNQIETERLIGMFANAVVLRTDLSGDPSFSEVLRRVRQVTLDAYRNQELPIEEILQALRVPRSLDRNPLFRVMFILQKASLTRLALHGLSARSIDADPGIARSDLLLELIDEDGRLNGWLEYSTELFEAGTIKRMAAHFRTLLESIVANPDQRISRLPLLPVAERKQVVVDWNQTETRLPRLSTFSERFDRQVESTPDAVAVSVGRVRLGYIELASRASAIAGRLCREDICRDEVVVLFAERGIDLLAAMIAVQRAGGAFLSLDPTMPAARLAQIIQHSCARVVLTTQDCAAALQMTLSGLRRRERPRILILEKLNTAISHDSMPAVGRTPSSLAYLIYTSGSTGAPKGVMIERRGMFNHLLSTIANFGLSASDVVAQTSPQSFVISVWQFLAAPLVGARVHVCADEVVRDPALLMNEISREGITLLQIVPALLREILRRVANEPAFHTLSRLRALISTGQSLAPDLCRDWFRHFPAVPIINAYGATEASDDVATHRLTGPPTSTANVPIGRAIANTRLYVLDSHLQPVPIGVAGELYVAGVGVGRGYLNDLEQTRHRFLRDPFSKRPGARLFRTGDLARWRADGTLECLGRIDHQVKIRGRRVELEEIEHILLEHSKVQSAAVVAREVESEVRLVAYIVGAADGQPKANELTDFLKTRFSAHMIPAGYCFLDHMPLTPHGKLDRAALLAIRGRLTLTEGEFVAPRNSTEEVLAGIWADLLEVEEVGIFSDFFDLGGHSLLAGRVLARVANVFRVSLPIRALFEATTIEALARRIDEARATQSTESRPEIARVERDGRPAISILQEHVLRIERELPGLPQFNLPFAYRLQGPLNVPALERSLVEVVRRHDSLRTGFSWVGERPVPFVMPASDLVSPLGIEDLAIGTSAGNNRVRALLLKKAELRAAQEAWKPFDMTRAPLFRTHLLRLGPDDHVLLLILHHIIVDGWSIGIFFEEVAEAYSAFAAGRQVQLPPQAFQFSDFADWQRRWCTTESATRQLAYWKDHLREASPVFTTDVGAAGALLTSRIAHELFHLSSDLLVRLSALSRSQGGTLFMTLLAGFKAMLLARTGRGDICVATAMANRTQQWTERVIGPMENTTLIRTQMDSDLSFREALSRVRDSVLEAYARQEFPFEILAARLAEEDDADPASLIQVFFVLQNAIRRPLELPDVVAQSFGSAHTEGQPALPIDRTWLTLSLKEKPSGLTGSCTYKVGLFEANTLQNWIAEYKAILAKAVANPEISLGVLTDR